MAMVFFWINLLIEKWNTDFTDQTDWHRFFIGIKNVCWEV